MERESVERGTAINQTGRLRDAAAVKLSHWLQTLIVSRVVS